jgi:hypothetical protein
VIIVNATRILLTNTQDNAVIIVNATRILLTNAVINATILLLKVTKKITQDALVSLNHYIE